MANYNFVVDSTFRPFTFDEMVKPLLLYKEAYDKAKEEYESMGDAEDFSYLLDETTPKDDPARKIYESYINERNPAFEDFSKNGLSLANQRSLLGLKSRYRRDIGRLKKAQTALDEERKLRRQAGSAMLWADDDLKLSSFLDNNTPNLYGVSRNDIYAKGVAKGKAYAARKVSMTGDDKSLGRYYIDFIQRKGYSAEDLYKFRDEINAEFMRETSSIPELQRAAQDVLNEMGVDGNLTGANLSAARSAVISGIMDGAIYEENHNPVVNRGVMSAAEAAADADRDRAYELQKKMYEDSLRFKFKTDAEGNLVLDEDGYPQLNPALKNQGYTISPEGKVVPETPDKPSIKQSDRDKALLELRKKDLANNDGFEVTVNNDRLHYKWVGAASKHGGKWHHGGIGEDNPGHNGSWWNIGLNSLGFASSSNVEDWWGNYTANVSDVDNDEMRLMSKSELTGLLKDPEVLNVIQEQLADAGYFNEATIKGLIEEGAKQGKTISRQMAIKLLEDSGSKYARDIQIAKVPSEWPYGDESGYLIAVQDY